MGRFHIVGLFKLIMDMSKFSVLTRLSLLIVIVVAFAGQVCAQTVTGAMKKYLDGCVALREAIENNDVPALTDAKLLLSKVELSEYSKDDFWPADAASESNIGAPKFMFTPQFANELIKKGIITIKEDVRDAHLMRETSGDLMLWHASIKPKSSASFMSMGVDDCRMLLFSLSDAKLRLKVETPAGEAECWNPLNDGSAWLASWAMPSDPSEFKFTIVNEGETPASFVIAIN